MKNYYCNTCGRQTPHKRFFHTGSSVAAYATCGLWLLARPFYPLRCIICGNKLGDPTTKADTHPLPETLRKCPLCAETIRLEAKKCRFCGHLFDAEEVDRQIQALSGAELHTPEEVELKQVEDSSITALAFVGAFIGMIIGFILGGIIHAIGGPEGISVMVFFGAIIAGIIIMIRLGKD